MLAGKDLKFCCLLIASLPLLSSCGTEAVSFKAASAVIAAASYGVFSDPDVNLKEKNYAAADFLQSKIKDQISINQFIIAEPLEEADHPGISSSFGMSVSEGVGLRLQELGYSVLLHDVAPYGNGALYPVPTDQVQANFVLRGAYAVKVKEVDVFLRVIDKRTQKVVGGFDYTMPLSREIRKSAETEPRIFRVKK
tara:strand:+ start:7193 stop:7777 length:585 start_codon:yes stop_codon:yes gene_type:complete